MYVPHVGEFIQRDPLPQGAPLLVYSDEAVTVLREQMSDQEASNLYAYAMNNPVIRNDPFGTTCDVQVQCWPLASTYGIFTHCGLLVDFGYLSISINGSGGTVNTINSDLPIASGSTGPATSYPDSACACLLKERIRWNGLKVPRDNLCHNSNWTLKCLTSKCGITLTWGAGVFSKPIGWDCEECIEPHSIYSPEGGICHECNQWIPAPCP